MEPVVHAITANILTIWVIYGFWRIKKDENDLTGILVLLAPLIIIGLIAYSLTPEMGANRIKGLQEVRQELCPR